MIASLVALILAYLVGSIPFGFLVARGFRKVDIRTVGSGNIGATNVGRVLGFKFFLLVFVLDYLKGLLPTLYFPRVATRLANTSLPDLPVLIAIASILGHNFPVYLRFKGGKGVATSLGAVSALDAVASVVSVTGFTMFLLLTRYVSMSSILGGLAWIFAHFATIEHPWARDQIAMTLASIGLMGLLVVRHRKNLVRIAQGTEPKVNLRKKKDRPAGKAASILVVLLAAIGGAASFAFNAGRKSDVRTGPYRAFEVDRVATGHQRAERLAFLDHGKLLAATCPRYGRVMLYRVTEAEKLELVRDIELAGKPVAIWPTSDRLFVLVRPNNDARHLEEGWWEVFDLLGQPVGTKHRAGFYPDDLAVTPDGKHLLVLNSGRGEGGPHRPAPTLTIQDSDGKLVGSLAFDQTGDDPARLALSDDGLQAAVSIQGSNALAWIDLSDPSHPRLEARTPWPGEVGPDAIRFDHRGGLLAANEDDGAIYHQAGPASAPVAHPIEGGAGDIVEVPGSPDFWAFTLPKDSGVGFLEAGSKSDRKHDQLSLKGRANLSATRPLGLAYNLDRRFLAVSNRSGGSIHLVALKPVGP